MGPLVIGVAAAVVVLAWAVRRRRWTGFEGKTLWDWMSLLAVPVLLAAGAGLINLGQNRLADARAEESAVQAYFGRISVLVLSDGDTTATDAIGSAQTAAVLRTVSGERAGRILLFLDEMDLLARYDVSYEGLDLRSAELKDVDLAGAEFEDADLAGADLEGANLAGADFEGANLSGADLKDAVLSGASFEDAELGRALLDHADLRGADLREVRGLSAARLAEACFDATTLLPDGLGDVGADPDACTGSAED
ncbi:MAG: pentapeptide repeat-containing protein [Acidimicrobiia bacterium]|nr:pentapeptide repeat-containing protein [Acidimicrobiia bacterium]